MMTCSIVVAAVRNFSSCVSVGVARLHGAVQGGGRARAGARAAAAGAPRRSARRAARASRAADQTCLEPRRQVSSLDHDHPPYLESAFTISTEGSQKSPLYLPLNEPTVLCSQSNVYLVSIPDH